MGRWEETKEAAESYRAFFHITFLNRSNLGQQKVLCTHKHQRTPLLSWNSKKRKSKTLWAFKSKWQRWGTSTLNEESIIEKVVACEKMREWRWKWMADMRVWRTPGGFYCYSTDITLAWITHCTSHIQCSLFCHKIKQHWYMTSIFPHSLLVT